MLKITTIIFLALCTSAQALNLTVVDSTGTTTSVPDAPEHMCGIAARVAAGTATNDDVLYAARLVAKRTRARALTGNPPDPLSDAARVIASGTVKDARCE